MTGFKIVWRRTVLEDLADAWTGAPDRNAITSAVTAAERKLRWDPAGRASGQVEGLYFLIEPPLRIGFTIDSDARTVTVVGLGVSPMP